MSRHKKSDSESSAPRVKRHHYGSLFLICIVIGGYVAGTFFIPLSPIVGQALQLPVLAAQEVSISWPTYGQTAIGAVGYGLLDEHGEQKPVPTASVAKVLTALAVMKQKPLLRGQSGPSITVTEEDIAIYQKYVAGYGSVVGVNAGEQLTEYQALQALLLPSANNIADLLANWAFGSQQNYVRFANNFVKSLGLKNTTIADASGYSADTVSTAEDLVLLAENVMDNPVLAEIVGQLQADIPVAGTIYNVNLLLGRDEIVGIKTGNTDEAGGCFMVAAKHQIDSSHSVTVVAVTLGAPDLSTAINSTLPLLDSIYKGFAVATLLKQGSPFASYRSPWAGTVLLSTEQDISGIIWKPKPPKLATTIPTISVSGDQKAGVYAVYGRKKTGSDVAVDLGKPSVFWRVTHPLR